MPLLSLPPLLALLALAVRVFHSRLRLSARRIEARVASSGPIGTSSRFRRLLSVFHFCDPATQGKNSLYCPLLGVRPVYTPPFITAPLALLGKLLLAADITDNR